MIAICLAGIWDMTARYLAVISDMTARYFAVISDNDRQISRGLFLNGNFRYTPGGEGREGLVGSGADAGGFSRRHRGGAQVDARYFVATPEVTARYLAANLAHCFQWCGLSLGHRL